MVNTMAIYKETKEAVPTAKDYAEIFNNKIKIEKTVGEALLNQALETDPALREKKLNFNLALRYDFVGNRDDEAIGLRSMIKEDYLRDLDDKDILKSLDFTYVNTSSGPTWTARMTFFPQKVINYFKNKTKNKVPKFITKNGFGYINFYYGPNPEVQIAEEGDNQYKLLKRFFDFPGKFLTSESIYKDFVMKGRNRNTDGPKMITNAIKEVQRKLKKAGYPKAIKFFAKAPKGSTRVVCYMKLP